MKLYNLEKSFLWTFVGIVLLFSSAIIVTLISPSLVDPSWSSPTNAYQVQMYEVSDPNFYISSTGLGEKQAVYHLKNDHTLLAFQESELVRIVAPEELTPFVTRFSDQELKLTSRLLLLREPDPQAAMGKVADDLKKQLGASWKEDSEKPRPSYTILELYDPKLYEAFAVSNSDSILENWVDQNFVILDLEKKQSWHSSEGVIYISNPQEYRVKHAMIADKPYWQYSSQGEQIKNLEELKSHPLGFYSRQELIAAGEKIYAIEGCWYCHTDQTRTLVQDVVLNGSAAFPAPPSSANEYIYQEITFPGTRRIGPDISRVGIKRPSRDWHKGHFWAPKTASRGSIMPSFRHFFDNDPRGSSTAMGIPNYQFEAIFQYLMTKGTRITPPTQAWWLGKDPIDTLAIINGEKKLP